MSGSVCSVSAMQYGSRSTGSIVPDGGVYARLSRDAGLLACYANETVMNSYACGWVDGWR